MEPVSITIILSALGLGYTIFTGSITAIIVISHNLKLHKKIAAIWKARKNKKQLETEVSKVISELPQEMLANRGAIMTELIGAFDKLKSMPKEVESVKKEVQEIRKELG